MADAKPIASLSSTLLARKGHAKPAMRPQGFSNFGFGAPHPADDLGWNDMGEGAAAAAATPVPTAEIVPITAVAQQAPASVEPPVVHLQQAEIAREMAPPVEQPVAAVVESTTERGERRRKDRTRDAVSAELERVVIVRAERGSKAKAAFTLRLDTERHLKLRLAGAIAHRSSQALVVDALDAYLATLPRVTELARDAVERLRGTDTIKSEDDR